MPAINEIRDRAEPGGRDRRRLGTEAEVEHLEGLGASTTRDRANSTGNCRRCPLAGCRSVARVSGPYIADGLTRITFVWLSHIAGPSGQWGVTRKNGKEITMDARLNYHDSTVAAKFAKYINSAGAVVSDSTLPAATQELVKIRASQINGCAACTDMHTKDAEHAGGSSVRLNLVAVWRRRRSSPRPSGPLWNSPSRAPASPMQPVVSPTRPGPMRPSTTTMTSSRRWCLSSPSSTPTTA